MSNAEQVGLEIMLGGFAVYFVARFVVPWLTLRTRLKSLRQEINGLRNDGASQATSLVVKDGRLGHLWKRYCDTLHYPAAAINQRTGPS